MTIKLENAHANIYDYCWLITECSALNLWDQDKSLTTQDIGYKDSRFRVWDKDLTTQDIGTREYRVAPAYRPWTCSDSCCTNCRCSTWICSS
jgi:hypothetical protein